MCFEVSSLSLQLFASATNQIPCINATDSVPPYRMCVFVLCRMTLTGFRPVGTAVAVKSAGRDMLLTAGHCVKFREALYFCLPQLLHPYNLMEIPLGAFNVEVVVASNDSPDIAILRRSDGRMFDIECPAIMPISDLPWNRDPHGWGGHAYAFHVPLDIIDHASNDEAGTPDVVGDVENVTLHMPTRHHFRLRSFERGSSGGAIISHDGRLMGVIAKTQLYGTLTMEGIRTHTCGGFEQLRDCERFVDSNGDINEDGWSISAASTAIPEKGSTAVIPSAVNLHYRGSAIVLSLPAFLQHEHPDAKCDIHLELAAKEGGTK